jgi:hypothetical protein
MPTVPTAVPAQCNDASRFDIIEEKLNEIKAIAEANTTKVDELKSTIATTVDKTWAQIAATTATTNTAMRARPIVGPEKVQQREQDRKERQRFEITLTANTASQEVKILLDKQQEKEIRMQLQKAIDAADIPTKPKITTINKLAKSMIRLQFKNPEIVNTVRQAAIHWDSEYEGIKDHKPIYGIVIHGVRTEAIDLDTGHSATIAEWEEENSMNITKVATLRRNPKHKPTTHHSLKVYTDDKEAANRCILNGFIIDSISLKAERYVPQWHLTQCYKCYGFNHRATECKRKATKCGKCSKDDHPAVECTTPELKCVNCNGNHESWHAHCQTRKEELQYLAIIRSDPTTTYFP